MAQSPSTTSSSSTSHDNGLHVKQVSHEHNATLPEGQAANDTRPASEQVGPEAAKSGAAGAPGKPKLDKFAYGFFDPQMAPFRKIVLKILGPSTVLMIIIMWLCLPMYWGSLWKSNVYTNKLTVRVIDRDGGSIGQSVVEGLLPNIHLKYFESSATEFPTDADVEHDVVQEGVWASIVVQPGATANLQQARQIGDSSYNGTSAIHVYYAQARQENAVGTYLLPLMSQALGQVTGQISAQSVAAYLQEQAGNQTAITALAQAPTTISQPVYYTLFNLRPYNQPVANAITLVGLIYMLIFAFIITMTGNAVREIIAPFMTTKSYIMYRLATPMLLYLPISFLFAMVSLPFHVHFGAHFTYAGGFFLWAFTLYLGMASVGLATEFAITLLGPQFMAFFLVPLIIVNVSVAIMPHELQPWIFRYGVAMPFFNVGRIVRTIIFNTKNEIGRNIGILIAWIVVSLINIALATWLVRRKSVNQHRREVGQNDMIEKGPEV